MALKFAVILTIFAAMTASSPVGYEYTPTIVKSYAPTFVKAAPVYKQLEFEAPAEYEFSYGVHDAHTGDIKSQQESRKGDAVHGRYELIEPDGHKRVVEYTADDHNGFNAVVSREGTNIVVPQPLPQVHKFVAPVAKVAYAAPLTYSAAPVAKIAYTAAPIAKIAYAAPVAPVLKYAAPLVKYSSGHESSHVTFSGPNAHYHY